jgi:Protein of unknown function (DUF4241)
LFCQQRLQRVHRQVALGEQPCEAGVLGRQCTQSLGVWDGHTANLLTPAGEGLRADPVLTTPHADGLLATLGLLQQRDELFLRKPAGLHDGPPFHERTLTDYLAQFSGSRTPWILFEAGALSKTLDKAYVCPYLFDISPADLAGPLIQFNAAKADKDDTRRLINTINKACGDKSIPHDRVDKAFEVWWPRLGEKLQNIRNAIPIRKAERAKRNERKILEETLELVREIRRGSTALAARRKVGYVGVDSGQVIITDPAHLHDFESNNFDGSKKSSPGRSRYGKKSKGFEYSYSGCCAATSTGGAGQLAGMRGVAVSTGMGDGAYPIYVEYENGMISSVTVQFLD